MKTEIINLLQTTQALDGGNQGINARDVHRLLKVGRDYSKWIKARINQAGFIENQDFAIVQSLVVDLPKLASKESDCFFARQNGRAKRNPRRTQ
ncbi:antA/AntB antirepressor family protein [Aggregatibacter aphrophilus]|uniref:antA/AntB antirepressor family protein n=1 Tax=Aggregatibacter aphrophilus TaxID=732 RepID=UPI001EF3F8ED|nr:antA/AntB antirepressor family protein [Aggregatibacter aphrophilus]